LRIPGAVARKLGHYVYVYTDPRDGRVFYVGKGKGQRALALIKGQGLTLKVGARLSRGVRG